MVSKRLFSEAEHDCEAELEPLRSDEVSLSPNNEGASRNEHAGGGRLANLTRSDPVYLSEHLGLPAWRVAHLESGGLHERQLGHRLAARVLNNDDGGSVQLRMHKQVRLVHVLFDESFVLLGVAASNDQVVLRGDEPDEFLKPEDLALVRLQHSLLKFGEVLRCSILSLLDGHFGGIACLELLKVRLFLNFEVLFNVEVGADLHVHIHDNYRVEVLHQVLVDLNQILVVLICVQHQRNLLLLKVDFVDHVRQWVVLLSLLLDHAQHL